eukprot:GFUD01042373.1.p1 GENE.GFUD01042373.1~~GFUD01042373.1.p1  ORF type:complete len:113 (+),score=11.93 GFUD01042373.1:116-454(+)
MLGAAVDAPGHLVLLNLLVSFMTEGADIFLSNSSSDMSSIFTSMCGRPMAPAVALLVSLVEPTLMSVCSVWRVVLCQSFLCQQPVFHTEQRRHAVKLAEVCRVHQLADEGHP